MDNNDIRLCYFGASGGFIVLHLMLCSGRFFCRFEDPDVDFETIINKQWQIPEPRLWKINEFWPDNLQTRDSKTDLRKIYFFCNPTIDEVSEFDGQIFFLYLDIDAHLQMAEYKHAGRFFNESTSLYRNYFSYYRPQLQNWINHYNNIKDPDWPKCLTPRRFSLLPLAIQEELLRDPHTLDLFTIRKFIPLDLQHQQKHMEKSLSQRMCLADGTGVLPEVYDFFQHADIALRLTDIINDPDLLCKITKTPTNRDQMDLRKRWLSLHPSSLLNNIGIKLHKEQVQHAEQS